jgi:hypothetical protein
LTATEPLRGDCGGGLDSRQSTQVRVSRDIQPTRRPMQGQMQDKEAVKMGRAEGDYVAAHTFEEREGAKGAASACGPARSEHGVVADAGGLPGKKKRKHKSGHGRRIERFLGYCRYCDMELERNTTNPRKCDGGGLGSILGNAVVMAGVLAMLAFAVVKKWGGSALDDSEEMQRAKLMLRDAGLVLLVAGVVCERAVRHLQSSCCCRWRSMCAATPLHKIDVLFLYARPKYYSWRMLIPDLANPVCAL